MPIAIYTIYAIYAIYLPAYIYTVYTVVVSRSAPCAPYVHINIFPSPNVALDFDLSCMQGRRQAASQRFQVMHSAHRSISPSVGALLVYPDWPSSSSSSRLLHLHLRAKYSQPFRLSESTFLGCKNFFFARLAQTSKNEEKATKQQTKKRRRRRRRKGRQAGRQREGEDREREKGGGSSYKLFFLLSGLSSSFFQRIASHPTAHRQRQRLTAAPRIN